MTNLKKIKALDDFEYVEKPLKRKSVFKGNVVDLRNDTAITPKGMKVTREYVKHNGGVCILAVNKEGRIALVRQYRYPVSTAVLELPAGKLEKKESPLKAAKRELEEEIGYVAGKITSAGAIYPCVGYSSEVIHLYIASNLKKTEVHFDDDEYIECKWFSKEELKWMLDNNMILDAKTIVLLYKYLNRDK